MSAAEWSDQAKEAHRASSLRAREVVRAFPSAHVELTCPRGHPVATVQLVEVGGAEGLIYCCTVGTESRVSAAQPNGTPFGADDPMMARRVELACASSRCSWSAVALQASLVRWVAKAVSLKLGRVPITT